MGYSPVREPFRSYGIPDAHDRRVCSRHDLLDAALRWRPVTPIRVNERNPFRGLLFVRISLFGSCLPTTRFRQVAENRIPLPIRPPAQPQSDASAFRFTGVVRSMVPHSTFLWLSGI